VIDAHYENVRREGRVLSAGVRLAKRIERFRTSVPSLAEWLEETAKQTLACFVLPAGAHRLRLRTTNCTEHDHAEIRRRTRVVRVFPNEASLVRPVTALAIERNEQWMERRYLTMSEDAPRHTEARQSV
jgi:putative transposase